MKLTKAALLVVVLLLTACKGGNRHVVESVANAVFAPRASGPREKRVQPQLVYSNLTYASLDLAAGAPSTVSVDMFNRGERPSGPFRVGVYVSTGRVVTGQRTLLGAAEVNNLTNAAPVHLNIPITAPAQPGSYAIAIVVDDRKQVPDQEGNGISASSQLRVR